MSRHPMLWLNLHYALRAVAIAGGGAFLGAHLLAVGIPPAGVMVVVALILLGRFMIRPFVVIFGQRYGLRRLVAFGTLVNAAQFVILGDVNGIGAHLLALIVVSSLGEMVYWTCYHAYFARLSADGEHGSQISVREAIATVVGLASPLAMAFALTTFGPRVAFGINAAIMALAAVPLFATPDVAVPRLSREVVGAPLSSIVIFTAEGWAASGYAIVWSIALFVALGSNMMAYGGALAFSALTGAVCGLVLGRAIDRGSGGMAVSLTIAIVAGIALLRAASTGNPALALFANALGAFGNALYIPTMMTAIYAEAKRAPCALRFTVATEGGWDIGAASGLLAAAALVWLGVPVAMTVLLCLLGYGVVFLSLKRYYAGRRTAATVA